MLNIIRTIASQWGNSPSIRAMIDDWNECIDPRVNLAEFYAAWWNVDTAYGAGLDNWGRIVGVSRLLHIPNDADTFGFSNTSAPPDWQPFNQGTFFAGDGASQTYVLDDAGYRTLILTKALANITATNARGLNSLLRLLFPHRGRAYVRDNGNMSMTFVFEFSLTPVEYAILTESGVLPHPAGVAYNVVVVPAAVKFFGFSEMGALANPFSVGIFYRPAS